MKFALWMICGILVSVCLVIGYNAWFAPNHSKEEKQEALNENEIVEDLEEDADEPDYILSFLNKNANSNNTSLTIHFNNQEWVELNPNEKLPLASTVKIIIAIEYARQASEGLIDPEQTVSIEELNKFYIANTDGGAHETWMNTLIDKNSIPLSEVAKGMIAYSSNANTDYLIHILGLQNINESLDRLELTNHDPLYPIVSALYIPTYLMNEQNLSKEDALNALKNMGMTEYRNLAIDIHNRWLVQPLTEQEKKQILKDSNMELQRIWSDRLPGSTTKDYVSIMRKLNSKLYFDESVHQHLDPIMEGLMENPSNQEWLTHAGQKGGSTTFVLTIAMYAKDKEGNLTEFALFLNDLSIIEQQMLALHLNDFQLKFLTDENFRTLVKNELSEL